MGAIELAGLCFLAGLTNPVLAVGPVLVYSFFGPDAAVQFALAALLFGLLYRFIRIR